MGIFSGLSRRQRRRDEQAAKQLQDADPAVTAARLVESVMSGEESDLELVVQAARLVVSTRMASTALLISRLHVSSSEAQRILNRLEHCGVIARAEGNRPRTVLTTSQQLPRVIEEFIERG